MISGEVDVGVVTSSAGLFNSLSRGAPIRALFCNGQGQKGRAVTAIIVRTDHYEAGIKSIADLTRIKGMTVDDLVHATDGGRGGRCGLAHPV